MFQTLNFQNLNLKIMKDRNAGKILKESNRNGRQDICLKLFQYLTKLIPPKYYFIDIQAF